jgi:hypothetical protein
MTREEADYYTLCGRIVAPPARGYVSQWQAVAAIGSTRLTLSR